MTKEIARDGKVDCISSIDLARRLKLTRVPKTEASFWRCVRLLFGDGVEEVLE